MSSSTLFELFIDGLCSSRTFPDQEAEETYRMGVWKQIVEGHGRHIKTFESQGIPVEEKMRVELASAIAYGESRCYAL